MAPQPSPDLEFIASLRLASERYFAAVDAWESAYNRFYRMPGSVRPSDDLLPQQAEFEVCKRQLQSLLPRARGLCLRYGQADVFGVLLHVSLGEHAPQHGPGSAVSRGQRAAVIESLIEMSVACQAPDLYKRDGASLRSRVLDYFRRLL